MGSSRTISSEEETSARARATRCCCPPESWDGSRSAKSCIFTWAMAARARSFASSLGTFRFLMGYTMFSKTVK